MEETVISFIKPTQNLEVYDPKTHILVPRPSEILKKGIIPNTVEVDKEKPLNFRYQIVYPDEFNLKPAPGLLKPRGRPKKPKVPVELPHPQKAKVKVVTKTRSGRIIKFPKYIENEFKKIEINDDQSPNLNEEVKVTDFVQYTEKTEDNIKEPNAEQVPQNIEQTDLQQKKRKIAAQYRCPKCEKAYLGKNKILEHLKKNPTHGPLHHFEDKNFEVWNYLVLITQKCPAFDRGKKFCRELSNLLQNLLLLTNALFKKLGSANNEVIVDKVLGNAIGLTPGTYFFDDSNLYRDVAVLKLMNNNDFVNSLTTKSDEDNSTYSNTSEVSFNCDKLENMDELLKSTMDNCKTTENSKTEDKPVYADISYKSVIQCDKNVTIQKFTQSDYFSTNDVNLQLNNPVGDYEMNNEVDPRLGIVNLEHTESTKKPENNYYEVQKTKQLEPANNIFFKKQADNVSKFTVDKTFVENEFFSSIIEDTQTTSFPTTNYQLNPDFTNQPVLLNDVNICENKEKQQIKNPKIKIQSDILICPANPKLYSKSVRFDATQSLSKDAINSELMSDNSVLASIHHQDELMLPVSTEPANMLDNSSSSDEVMNVDQFVNERFKKITEPDIEGASSNSLNLELPNLDFSFTLVDK